LLLKTSSGALRLHTPRVYQELSGGLVERTAQYVLRRPVAADAGDGRITVGFRVAAYDPAAPLIIDPILSYSTFLGGSGIDEGHSIAVDSSGNAYIAGETDSVDFPTASPFQVIPGVARDAFVAKLNVAGSALAYATYLGGTGDDIAFGVTVDATGNAYVTGLTSSTNFPTASPLQAALAGDHDVFVTKLDAAGAALVYSTYLGGTAFDIGRSIAVDAGGGAYVTGYTLSNDFPTTVGAFDTTSAGQDAFVTNFNPSGTALVYATYLGGTGPDVAWGISVDIDGSAFVTGMTGSPDFPTASPFQAVLRGPSDAFVTKLRPDGSGLLYSTYLGGSVDENFTGVAAIDLDAAGNAYVAGTTSSADFPTATPFQAALAGARDAFVTKLDPSGSGLVYSTYLGGSSLDDGSGIAVDGAGNAYVTGFTFSSDFPTANAVQPAFGGGGIDAFVTKLDATGSGLIYSTYLGGRFDDVGLGIATAAGSAYVTGRTASADFPAGAVQPSFGGAIDGFVAKITTIADVAITKRAVAPGGTLDRYEITVTNNGPETATCVTVRDPLPDVLGVRSASSSQGTCSGSERITCSLGNLPNGSTATITLQVAFNTGGLGLLLFWHRNTATVSAAEFDPDLSNNSATESPAPPPGPSAGTSTGDSGGGGCFIATAAYGSYLDPHVQVLRDFRDRYLMKSSMGRDLVSLYYTYSPPTAEFIARHKGLRLVTRAVLTPVVYAISYPTAAGLLLLAAVVGAGFALWIRRGAPERRV
jgi:uncharacterized repeat protein (TIGR01451 family)